MILAVARSFVLVVCGDFIIFVPIIIIIIIMIMILTITIRPG